MSADRIRLLIALVAILVGGVLLYVDLRDGDPLQGETVGVVTAFTTAAVALGTSRTGT